MNYFKKEKNYFRVDSLSNLPNYILPVISESFVA